MSFLSIKNGLLVLFFVFSLGCAMQEDVINLQRDMTGLKGSVHNLQTELRGELDGGSDQSLRRSLADLGARLETMRGDSGRVQGLIDESQHHSKKLSKQIDSLELELDFKLSQINENLTDLANRINFIEKHLSIEKPKFSKRSSPADEKYEKIEGGGTEIIKEELPNYKLLYQTAYENLKKGMVESAKENFKEFIKLYPKTELTDNAQYWLGECYYVQGNYEDAILEFDKVIHNYPEGDKVKGALLKEGLAFYYLGDNENAKIILQRIIKTYPRSPQAKIAKKRIEEIK